MLAPEAELRASLLQALEGDALQVTGLSSEQAFFEHLADAGFPELVVVSVEAEKGGDRHALLMGLLASDERPSVVVVGGEADRGEMTRLIQGGAYGSVRMPIQADELRAVCQRALRLCAERAELVRLRGDLEDFRGFVASALTHLFEGVLLIDPGGRVLFANKAGARIMLRPREELIGKRMDAAFSEGFRKAIQAARSGAEGWVEDEVALCAGAKILVLDCRAVVVRDLGGRPVGGLLAFRPAAEQPPDPAEAEAKAEASS